MPNPTKLLQGVYRGFTGDATEAASAAKPLFTANQRQMAEYYAKRRAAETGDDPHVEMLLIDPFVGQQYRLHPPGVKGAEQTEYASKVRKVKPDEVQGRTKLYAEGGLVKKAKDIATQTARGWTAGLAGLPGDLEGLARMAIKYGASPGSYVDRNMSETPALPTSEFYNEWLPGGDWETPEGGAAQAIATVFGGIGATKLAKPVASAAQLAEKYGVQATKAAAKNAAVPRTLSTQAGVIKAPGGNWLSGSVEDALKGLKHPVLIPENVPLPTRALNSWIDKKLATYVKNDMATERDPVRALAERGVLHFDPGQDLYARRHIENRIKGGFPVEDTGVSMAAKNWENVSDASLYSDKAGDLLRGPKDVNPAIAKAHVDRSLANDPWLAKVPPETQVYKPDTPHGMGGRLGFDHLIDELRNATNPNSGLPRELLLKYDALDRVTVPQAVERVAKINEWRAAQKAEADMARANNAATVLHKEYPEKGMKWVELKSPDFTPYTMDNLPKRYEMLQEMNPRTNKMVHGIIDKEGSMISDFPGSPGSSPEEALENFNKWASRNPDKSQLKDALKYEGDTMGHCVGGYCDRVADGSTRIYSLRDAKGRPHVTVEVQPGQKAPEGFGPWEQVPEEVRASMKARGLEPTPKMIRDGVVYGPDGKAAFQSDDRVLQIKGKGNKKPNDEYLPFVQDFVKSGKWSDVGDLQNSGLVPTSGLLTDAEIQTLKTAGKEVQAFHLPGELRQMLEDVGIPHEYGELSANPARRRPQGFADGGLVSNDYDPARVDALVAQLQAEFA